MATMARDAADLAEMKRLDQGNHECEVLAEGAEGATEWGNCSKNPGHEGFIPAPEFSIDHLPEKYRDEQLYQHIKCMIDLTVKIKVMCVSADRPDGYPFSKFRGKSIPHIGSGCVRYADNPSGLKVAKKKCQCSSCEKSGKPEEMWWRCIVTTAKHVVFNTEEARNAVIELFYDQKNRDAVKYLYGIYTLEVNTYGDRCEFSCVTHDAKVAEQLEYSSHMSLYIRNTISKKCKPRLSKQEANLCIVISHPHGCSKHVTLGNWKECLKQRRETVHNPPSLWYKAYNAYTYNTPTCPGSSGGCTIIMNLRDVGMKKFASVCYISHTHSSGNILNGQNANTSSYWPYATGISGSPFM